MLKSLIKEESSDLIVGRQSDNTMEDFNQKKESLNPIPYKMSELTKDPVTDFKPSFLKESNNVVTKVEDKPKKQDSDKYLNVDKIDNLS